MYQYATEAPEITAVEASTGFTLLNFGTNWCTHCQAAIPSVSEFLQQHGQLAHIAVEDGRGRPLGRHYQVKLWPSLILLHHGQEVARVVRPTSADDLAPLAAALNA